ncbi:MAG: HipA domain-containing protein [Nitrococcus sp.]|nr:HipA domain-containing protein [Nitrococcus sp.]
MDGHAKNFSIAIKPRGRYQLTPLYDLISAWPVLGHGANQWAPKKVKMAMAAISHNRHYRWADIQPRHWLSTARACGLDQGVAYKIIHDLVQATPGVIANMRAMLPAKFPRGVGEPILQGLESAATKLGSIKLPQ